MSKKDLLKVAKREKYFSTLAKKEGKGALAREKEEARKGYKEASRDSKWEVKIDNKFAKIRAKKAQVAKKKAGK